MGRIIPRRLGAILLVAALTVIAAIAGAGQRTFLAVDSNHIAIKGYDPVAYFTAGKPTPGMDAYTLRWKGVTYRFASAENRERFKAAPEQYAPQYGGYCAYAMSINRIADIDPARWTIVDGKLYLNNNLLSQTLWSVSTRGKIVSADQHWAVFPKTAEAK